MLLLLGTVTPAQSPRLKSVDLCNGKDRTSPERQITGCTALIDSGSETAHVLTIAHNNRGNAYMAKGEHDRGMQDYDKAIKLDPRNAKAFNNRGVAYHKKGDYDRALKDLDESIKLDPAYANAFANRAHTYQKQGEHGRAVRDYDEAIARAQVTSRVAWTLLDPRHHRRIASGIGGLQQGAATGVERRSIQFAWSCLSQNGPIQLGDSGL